MYMATTMAWAWFCPGRFSTASLPCLGAAVSCARRAGPTDRPRHGDSDPTRNAQPHNLRPRRCLARRHLASAMSTGTYHVVCTAKGRPCAVVQVLIILDPYPTRVRARRTPFGGCTLRMCLLRRVAQSVAVRRCPRSPGAPGVLACRSVGRFAAVAVTGCWTRASVRPVAAFPEPRLQGEPALRCRWGDRR